jgi:hypothetical protein
VEYFVAGQKELSETIGTDVVFSEYPGQMLWQK